MQKRNIKKHGLAVNTVYALAGILSVVFLIASLVFISYADDEGLDETVNYLRHSTALTTQATDSSIQRTFDTLSALSVLSASSDTYELEGLVEYFEEVAAENHFLKLGFLTPDGETEWLNSENELQRTADPAAEAMLPEIMKGSKVVSSVIRSSQYGYDVIYYAVPVYRDSALIGGMFAVASVNELRDVLDSSLFGGIGYAHIVDEKGNFIIRSNYPGQSTNSGGIFDVSPPMSESEVQEILDTMASRESGFAVRNTSEGVAWGSYEPLDYNDWYVFYIVHEDQINQGFNLMKKGITVFVIVTVSLFIFFIYLIRQLNEGGRHDLETMAYTDELTGQRSFRKFLLDAQEILDNDKERWYSLWYSDIKNFKTINDLFGYEVGDRVLKYWATLLEQDMKPGEIFGRVGADNFVCLRLYEGQRMLEDRFGSDAKLLSQYHETAVRGYNVEISAGIYVSERNEANMSINDMLDRANLAQKSVKSQGGSRFAVYSNEIREAILRETEMESRMELALEEREFEMFLQPKVDIQDGNRISAMEALVRWNWPGRGYVRPDEFIPLFEKNGFIVKLDQYMMETACMNYKKYVLDGTDDMRVLSVNVSRLCMLQPDFIDTYTNIRDKYQIPDNCIELEFTESIAFEDYDLFRSIVKEFQKRGFLCSLDDFGSGHSSLNLLKNLNVDVLKLDRLFFQPGESKHRDVAIIRTIIEMSKTLGMQTVAEGVETSWQVDELRAMGCNLVQGFIFSRPLSIDDFHDFVLGNNNHAKPAQ